MFKTLEFSEKSYPMPVDNTIIIHSLISNMKITGLDINIKYDIFTKTKNNKVLGTDILISDNHCSNYYPEGGFQTKMTVKKAKEFCNNHFQKICQGVYNSIMEV